ncbi:hypothetical protein KY284_001051 [Solanum tuberosum]|nr:hypothetical protein KY284_001051 [Solanum tuberosum]
MMKGLWTRSKLNHHDCDPMGPAIVTYTHSSDLMNKVTRHNEALGSSNTSGEISYGNPMLTVIIKENQEGDQMISNLSTTIDMLTKRFAESSSKKVNAVEELTVSATLKEAINDRTTKDQLIQNALMDSVKPTNASIVTAVDSAKSPWNAFQTTYANKSQTWVFSLRDQLSRVTKDSHSITEYLHNIRSFSDELATIGAPVSNPELIVKILSGLGP